MDPRDYEELARRQANRGYDVKPRLYKGSIASTLTDAEVERIRLLLLDWFQS